MLDIGMEEKLVEKVGGKFKLTLLIQKRLIELNQGARPLVEVESPHAYASGPPNRRELLKIIVREILDDKICLAPADQLQLTLAEEAASLKPSAPSDADIFSEELKKIKQERLKELSTILQPKE